MNGTKCKAHIISEKLTARNVKLWPSTQTREAMSLNELKMYKIAMWNHRKYSHVYMWHWW